MFPFSSRLVKFFVVALALKSMAMAMAMAMAQKTANSSVNIAFVKPHSSGTDFDFALPFPQLSADPRLLKVHDPTALQLTVKANPHLFESRATNETNISNLFTQLSQLKGITVLVVMAPRSWKILKSGNTSGIKATTLKSREIRSAASFKRALFQMLGHNAIVIPQSPGSVEVVTALANHQIGDQAVVFKASPSRYGSPKRAELKALVSLQKKLSDSRFAAEVLVADGNAWSSGKPSKAFVTSP